MHPGVTYKVRICENVWKFVEDAPALLPYIDLLPAAPNSALDLDTDKGHSDCRSDKWTCNWKESTCFIVSFYKHPNILKCQHVLSLCEEAKMSKLIAAWHPRWGVADAPRIAAEVVQLGCLNHPFAVRTFCEPQTCFTFAEWGIVYRSEDILAFPSVFLGSILQTNRVQSPFSLSAEERP